MALTVLSGCAGEPIATPSPSTTAPQMPTAAPTRTADPTVMPENRFGLPCDELLAPDELTRPFGMPLELRLPTGFGRVDVPALIQDGTLLCRWGDGTFLDDSGTAFTVTAAPRGAKSFDEIVALALGGPFLYTAVEVVGPWDRGLAECSPPDGSGFAGVFCAWTEQVGELWVVLELDRLGADQVEANLTGEPLAGVTPREDSAASALVARVVQQIANANGGEVLAVENQLPPLAQRWPIGT